jgi:phosphoglycerol transferase MdoB-like AlkP superfamily enzyme
MKTSPTPSREWRALLGLLVTALLLILAPRDAAAAEPSWALEDHRTPNELWVDNEVEVELHLRNLGIEPWRPALGDRISYHWRSPEGELLIRDGLRTELPGPVRSGEEVRVRARLRPPEEPGRYLLEWAMVREQVRWFPPPRGGPQFHEVEVGVGELGWAPVSIVLPKTLEPGVTSRVLVRLRNTGEIPWQPELGDRVAYHWWSEEGELLVREGRRTPLPGRVESGAEVELELELHPPSHAGPEPLRVCLELEPVREGERWFGPPSRGALLPCTRVAADPSQWRLIDEQTPVSLALDDDERRVRVVVGNLGPEIWGEDVLLGSRWRPPGGGELIDGPRTELPGPIVPGQSVELEARLAPPDRPGRWELVWGLVREGERWFPAPRQGEAERRIEVTGPRLAWGLVEAEALGRVWVNRSTEVEVEVENLGTETWSEASGDHLAYHWRDAEGEIVHYDGMRTSFAAPVAPGERVRVRAKVRGPSRPGRYRLEWEMVREHERWYGPPVEAPELEEPEEVRARWLAAVVAVIFAGLTLAGAVGLRLRPPQSPRARRIVTQLPLAWAGVAIWTLSFAFHDLSAIEARRHASLLAASGAFVFVTALALARDRARVWLAPALVSALALLALADLVYMHYFGSIVPVVALTASHHLGEVGDSALAELDVGWGWLAVVPLAGWIAAGLWPTRARERTNEDPVEGEAASRGRWSRAAWRWLRPQLPALGMCLVLASPAALRLGWALGSDLGTRVFSEREMVRRFGYLNAHLFDLARTIRERSRRGRPSEAELARVRAWFEARAESVEAATRLAAAGGEAAGHNLLLIQIEAAQTWVIGLEIAGQEITPTLNRMREEADWYPYLVDQTNQGKTSDAEYAVLNSQHPLGEGAICFLRADNHFFTLAHVLAEHGYATFSAHPYKRGFWNRAVLHPRYGFERSAFRRELGPGQEVGWGLADGLFFERVLARLEALPQPWFAFLITLSLHHPYDEFPDRLAELELGALEGTRVGNYLEAMNYFDRSLARLLEGLDERGLLEHTVVALYGDHDARFELDEYPEVVELAGAKSWDPALFHRLERVPLFVRVPPQSRPPLGRVGVTGGHVDVAPTLLHALGIERPRAFVGQPLLPGMEAAGFAAYPDGSAYGPIIEAETQVEGANRMYVAEGRGIPREGGCFEFPAGGSRPLPECEALAERAAQELEVSRAVVDHDLHRELEPRE